ncbi:MAG: GNAT family N-acetyltransferase [Pyrinomonadaceae bacterium]
MENDDLRILLPAGGTVSLRTVSPEDEEFLLAVYASTRAEELAQVPWSDEQKTAFVRWQFDLQRKEYDANYPHTEYNVIVVDGRRAGRIWISRDDEQVRLLDIALLEEFQNRGVGTVLLRGLINEAASGNKALRHMVFTPNKDARRFYERLGFVVFEEVGAYLHMEWRPESSDKT